MQIRFHNVSRGAYMTGPCAVGLERRDGEQWKEVEGCAFGAGVLEEDETSAEVTVVCDLCQAYAVTVASDDEWVLSVRLYAELPPGAYRVAAEVSPEEALAGPRHPALASVFEPVRSNPFTVRP